MKQYKRKINGVTEYFREPLIADGKQIFNPSEEQIKAAGWEEYTPEETASEEYVPTYEEKVVELIRERYSVDDEIAILRQKDTKQEEYQAWYDFCEECKREAKETENLA
jgi:hypothetical protein